MCDFSTWISGLGDTLSGAVESGSNFLGDVGSGIGSAITSIPSAAEDFGSYLGGLFGPALESGADAGGFLAHGLESGAVAGMESIPLPAAAPFGSFMEGALPEELYQFSVTDPEAVVGTAPLQAAIDRTPLGFAAEFGTPAAAAPPPDPSLFSQASGFMKDNYKWMLPALGIGYSALRPKAELPGAAQQEAYAQRMGQIGQQMTEPLLTGQLPAGYQSALDRMQKSAEAQVKSRYAQMGLSGSSMERQELAAIPQQLETQKLQIAQSLAAQGMQSMGLSSAAYNQIAQATLAQDKELANALAAFGAAAIRS